jgi:hypothetical protein
MKKAVIYVFLSAIFFSCGPQERVSRETIEEVNSNMEIKRLTEVEILDEAMTWGDSITAEAQKLLISQLQKAIEEKGVPGAVDYCHLQAIPILAQLSQKHQVQLRRVSNAYRNPADQPTIEEKPLLEAYEYNAEGGFASEPNIQKFEKGEVLLYTKPIVIPNGMCLNCHGEPGKDISKETQEKIDDRYPDDKATGHRVGDLRGMWSVRIPKKEVVKRL